MEGAGWDDLLAAAEQEDPSLAPRLLHADLPYSLRKPPKRPQQIKSLLGKPKKQKQGGKGGNGRRAKGKGKGRGKGAKGAAAESDDAGDEDDSDADADAAQPPGAGRLGERRWKSVRWRYACFRALYE